MKEKYFMNKKVQSRRAIAMIELIFAIVIIGITLLSIPNLIYQASESGYTTIQQESIAAAASDLSLVLSREWDENGTSDKYHTPILTTTAGSSSLDTRPGAKSRSFFTGIGGPFPASTIANDGDFDDIDDAHDQVAELHLMDGTKDLIDVNISITATVNYIKDTSSPGTLDNWDSAATLAFSSPFEPTGSPLSDTSNIKLISLKLTSNSPIEELADKEIVFTAFSCNIGSYKLERREF